MIRQKQILLTRHFEDDHKPKVIPWKNSKMIRVHSIRAAVKEMISKQKALDVVKVGIVGDPSTGKTTLAKTIAHLVHKMSPGEGGVNYAVRVFGKDEFLKFDETLAALQPANYVLIFDDLSFLGAIATKRQMEMVKRVITTIRHLPGGQDVKIITIMDYHYTLGLDKYLRQAHFRFFTSIGSSEDENMIRIIGTKYAKMVKDFQIMFAKMTSKPYVATFKLKANPKTHDDYFKYQYKDPFVPCIFFNEIRPRYVVFPMREWIDPICSTCSIATGMLESEIPVAQFCEEAEKKFEKPVWLSGVKLTLFEHGLNSYSAPIVSAKRYLSRSMEKKLISLQAVAAHYNIGVTKARLREKLDGVLE